MEENKATLFEYCFSFALLKSGLKIANIYCQINSIYIPKYIIQQVIFLLLLLFLFGMCHIALFNENFKYFIGCICKHRFTSASAIKLLALLKEQFKKEQFWEITTIY